MKCRDFQYEEGGEYEQSGEIKCCENGFHACESPLDCFSYYAPADSVYHEVELDGKIATEENGNDTKVAASKIKIGAELNFFGIAKAHVEWVKENVKNCKTNTGDYSAATNTGLKDLLAEIAKTLPQLPKTTPFEATFVPEDQQTGYEIEIADDGAYVVSGGLVNYLARIVVLSDYESFQFFQSRLQKLGVYDALREKGIQDGDIVRILDIEFEYQE